MLLRLSFLWWLSGKGSKVLLFQSVCYQSALGQLQNSITERFSTGSDTPKKNVL